MPNLEFHWFPFKILGEYAGIKPNFRQDRLRIISSKDSKLRLVILGPKEPFVSLIKIDQIASFMEIALNTNDLEWKFIGMDNFEKNYLVAVLSLAK